MTRDRKLALRQEGFTLIEVLVALMILASISIYTAQSIRNSALLKSKLQSKIDRQSKFRAALNLMDRDLKMAFHYHNYSQELYESLKKNESKYLPTPTPPKKGEAAPAPNQSNVGLFDLSKYKYSNLDPTEFLGEADSLHFTNLGGVNTKENQKNSSQQEVGYFIKTCRNRLDPKKSYNCLWRRTSPFIDEKTDTGGEEFVLLENVKVFKLRYFGEGKEDWVNIWLSNDRGDAVTKGKFPQAVEISIAFEEDGKTEEAVMVSSIPFPNNVKKTNSSGETPNL